MDYLPLKSSVDFVKSRFLSPTLMLLNQNFYGGPTLCFSKHPRQHLGIIQYKNH